MATLVTSIKSLCLTYAAENRRITSPAGAMQTWLLDLRPLFMRKEALEEIAAAFWRRYESHAPFQLAGMETAAIPLLTALVLTAPPAHKDLSACIIRKERKPHGLGNAIEGRVAAAPVVLIDDTFNSGSSAEKARVVLEEAGLRVGELFVVIDYQSDRGKKWLADHRVKMNALFNLSEFDLAVSKPKSAPKQKYRKIWVKSVVGANSFHVVPKSAPVLAGNRVYRGCDAGKMHCFDADTGEIVWEYASLAAFSAKGIWSVPAVHDGRLYFGAYNGSVYCLDAATGQEIWRQSLCEWVGASPLVIPEHNIVCFGLEYERPWARGGIAALNLDTGEHVWDHLVERLQHGSPAHWWGGDLVLWGSADYEMLGLKAKTGEPVWSFKTRRSVKYAPAVDEGRGMVAFASFDKSIYILDVATGKLLGEFETGEICYTTPLFAGNRLFCGSGDRHMYVIDLDKMALEAKINMGARVFSSPTLIGDRVVFGTNGGKVIELNQATLEVEGTLQLPDAVTNKVAASDDGRFMYVSTYMNHLFKYERHK